MAPHTTANTETALSSQPEPKSSKSIPVQQRMLPSVKTLPQKQQQHQYSHVATVVETAQSYEGRISPVNRPLQYDMGPFTDPEETHRRQVFLNYFNSLPVSDFSHIPHFHWCGVRVAPMPNFKVGLVKAKEEDKSSLLAQSQNKKTINAPKVLRGRKKRKI